MSQLNCRPQSCQLFGSCINAFFSAGLFNSHRLPLPLHWMRAFLQAASSCKSVRLHLHVCYCESQRQSQAFISGLHTMCDFISTWQPIFRWQRTGCQFVHLKPFIALSRIWKLSQKIPSIWILSKQKIIMCKDSSKKDYEFSMLFLNKTQ